MNKLFAALSLSAFLAACAVPDALPDPDFSESSSPQNMALGTVKSVRTVRIERDIHAFDELRIQPDVRDEIIIRLDDGDAVTVMVKETQRFQAGQRVRVISDTYNPYGPSVEHE